MKVSKESQQEKSFFRIKVVLTKNNSFTILFEREIEMKNFVAQFNKVTEFREISDHFEIMPGAIGKGRFGVIKKGRNLTTGQIVAIKELNKKRIKSNEMLQTRREVDALKVCKHSNIVQVYDFFENLETIYIVMEYCGAGDLFE